VQRELLELLICPVCRGELTWSVREEQGGDVLAAQGTCPGGHAYEIRDGVAGMLAAGGPDPWEENVSGIERALAEHPEIAQALFAPQPDALGPADRFLRVQLLQARGQFDLAEEEYEKAAEAVYGRASVEATSAAVATAVRTLATGEGPILDIASGPGTLVRELLGQSARPVIATDISAWVLRRLRAQAAALGLPVGRLSLLVCDARRLPLRDGAVQDISTMEGIGNVAFAAAMESRRLRRGAALELLAEWRRVGTRLTSVQSLLSPWNVVHRVVLGYLGAAALLYPAPLRALLAAAGWRAVSETGITLVHRPTPRSELLRGTRIDGLPLVPVRASTECLVAVRVEEPHARVRAG